MVDPEGFLFGIEHEFPVRDTQCQFRDFTNTKFEEFDAVIKELPVHKSDYDSLRVGDLGIKKKRWYIEGFERFGETGEYLRTDPKGFEIRTPIQPSIDAAVNALEGDIARWRTEAEKRGYHAVLTSFNPYQAEYTPQPPLNEREVQDRQSPEEQTAYIAMLTYGPDISISHPGYSAQKNIDLGMKLTFYSPYMVPFSYSSPFFLGSLWGGYSRRTYYRTGRRPAALVFVGSADEIIESTPTLTDRARLAPEVGRVEFKAFDCPRDVAHFRALGTLILGLALDTGLPGRALVPDEGLHKRSARAAFDDPDTFAHAQEVLDAAEHALPVAMREALTPLREMLNVRETPAHGMIESFSAGASIIDAIAIK
ncbi:MAG: glutamate--cysteine ligase [Coriobacteriia bacterium]|nr:glutamate--cysteine ligase [Coriobacteriia bacterium]